ncbi:hypothetical protein GG344DRAFT_71219, partial [Lentinula edodes]
NLSDPALSIEPPMSSIGAQPVPIERFSSNTGLRTRSIRCLLVYMENVMAELNDQVQTQEQRDRTGYELYWRDMIASEAKQYWVKNFVNSIFANPTRSQGPLRAGRRRLTCECMLG